jgi:hypothetical protein
VLPSGFLVFALVGPSCTFGAIHFICMYIVFLYSNNSTQYFIAFSKLWMEAGFSQLGEINPWVRRVCLEYHVPTCIRSQ